MSIFKNPASLFELIAEMDTALQSLAQEEIIIESKKHSNEVSSLCKNLLETGTLFKKKDFNVASDDANSNAEKPKQKLDIFEDDAKLVENMMSAFDDES